MHQFRLQVPIMAFLSLWRNVCLRFVFFHIKWINRVYCILQKEYCLHSRGENPSFFFQTQQKFGFRCVFLLSTWKLSPKLGTVQIMLSQKLEIYRVIFSHALSSYTLKVNRVIGFKNFLVYMSHDFFSCKHRDIESLKIPQNRTSSPMKSKKPLINL